MTVDVTPIELVDQEVRGKAPEHLAEALRAPELVERWFAQLVTMKKSAESQLAAKSAEDRASRLELLARADACDDPGEAARLRAEALEARASYLRWRAGVLRFRSGVEERLAEAGWRRRVSPTLLAASLVDERRQLMRAVSDLKGAIEEHRASMEDLDPEDIDEADERLWRWLS